MPEPFVQLDESMVILHVDITFDDYNTSVLNTRNASGYMNNTETATMMLPQMNTSFPQATMPGDQSSYFYLRDNPQQPN